MKTKPPSSNHNNSSKSHSKRSSSSRERDKKKSTASVESGTSSQCDTPPLTEKDSNPSYGKFAGISPESVQCMAEQVSLELSTDASTNLAEDVSFKLRQLIHNVAVHTHHMKKNRVEVGDVNNVLKIMDTGPVLGAGPPQWLPVSETDNVCFENDTILNVVEAATIPQAYVSAIPATVSVEWLIEDKYCTEDSNISPVLQNYYNKISRAILNGNKKMVDIALKDLSSNVNIGPLLPNLFNLAVLILNDDNMVALNVPIKLPLQVNMLNMMEALSANPCSEDTYIQQQLQRLFPIMVSNILGGGPLADRMIQVLSSVTNTWPTFAFIGKGILYEYLSQGIEERLSGPMVQCLVSLGRHALIECLSEHLDYVDVMMHAETNKKAHLGLFESMLDASSVLLKVEQDIFLEDFMITDSTLYEMLGDSILPRRIYQTHGVIPVESIKKISDDNSVENEFNSTTKLLKRRQKFKMLPKPPYKPSLGVNHVFEPVKFSYLNTPGFIRFNVTGCRPLTVRNNNRRCNMALYSTSTSHSGQYAVAASGVLLRFKYKLPQTKSCPLLGMYTL